MHAVFIQNPKSIYRDACGERYHFPNAKNLDRVKRAIGDWVVFYQGRRSGQKMGYAYVQKVLSVRPDPENSSHSYAELDPASTLDFETFVGRRNAAGRLYESGLAPMGGNNQDSVRPLSDGDFAAIVNEGLREVADIDAHPRTGPLRQMAEDQAAFATDRRLILTSRPARDAAFARMVRRAYKGRCAISGLRLRNGGGRAEVQACHIRSVQDGGPDVVRNGIALSGTLHWMFDRGLIRVADDHSLLISHNKVDLPTIERLVNPQMRLMLDDVDPRHRPHPDYLRWHREKDYA